MKIGDIEYPSLKGKVSDAEWQTRVELAAIYRLIPLLGWYDLVMAPASARIPGEQNYLYNPSELLFEEVTASSLVKINLDGELAADTPFSYLRAGWYPMQAAHAAREDANWVIHVHDDYGMALSTRKERLLPITQTAGFALADGVAYHSYDGVETYKDRVAGLQQSLGTANRLILHNHGLLTVGLTAWQALSRMTGLRKACRVQLLAGFGKDLIHIEPEILDTFVEELRVGPAVNNAWPGLLRKLDRLNPSYKD
jgi:ribulose-5-phosphate 4-epimerase/fuculose-1-phosphate aldolase